MRLAASAHAEAAVIVDALRRAHLIDGVPWSQMAVIVRSVPRAGARLPRALAAAGVPVAAPAEGGPLGDRPAARALLTVLAATADGLDGEQALALLTGPIGRVDPVSLRQLRRTLQRANPDRAPGDFKALLVEALTGAASRAGAQSRPLQRVRAVLDAAARCHAAGPGAPASGGDPRYTLWAAWHRSGLQRRWLSAMRARRPRRRPGRPGPGGGHRVVRRHRPVRRAHVRCLVARPRRSRLGAAAAGRRPRAGARGGAGEGAQRARRAGS